jgi:hypothetical protein
VPVREVPIERLTEAMKRSAAILREAEVPFALAGGLACWARGGPATDHDVDFLIRPKDADRAAEAMARADLRVERPPEGWLVKTYVDDTLVDLVFEPAGGPVTDDWFARADHLEVKSMRIPVASLEDVLTTKLLALTEQEPDYGPVLEIGRTLREQIDWDEVRERTDTSPFAKAYFTLLEELGIIERAPARG